MTETVLITPQTGLDANDNPLPAATPFTLTPRAIAPGDTTIKYGPDGDLDAIVFTVYLPLQVKRSRGWVNTRTALTNNFTITVRGHVCVGRIKEWNVNGFGGIAVVATAETGATP